MAVKSLFQLVTGALPGHFDARCLKKYGKPEWWANNERLAIAYALRKCPLINWHAYLENYPDIAAAGLDPVLHFLNDGLLEGRRLSVWTEAPEPGQKRPKVSVIVANYNQGFWLEHGIASLTGQTLKNIEIIIVDDGSTDESPQILERLASQNPKIRLIRHSRNRGLHMARKSGVNVAKGQYITFVDADDYLKTNALEVAYKAAAKGYDIVTFGVEVRPGRALEPAAVDAVYKWMNGGADREYRGLEICDAMFINKAPSRAAPAKLYEAQLVKTAFGQMEDFEIYSGEDVYEIAALAARARTMLKIPEKLYIYRMGTGHSTTADAAISAKSALEALKIAPLLKKLCAKSGMARYYQPLVENIALRARDAFMELIPDCQVTEYFNAMAENLGIAETLNLFVNLPAPKYEALAKKFQHYENCANEIIPIKTVGILLTKTAGGGILTVVNELITGLLDAGYSVTVFLHYATENDERLDARARLVYLGTTGDIYTQFGNVAGLVRAFRQNPVDVLICSQAIYRLMLFQNMLLKYLGIKILCIVHQAFYYELLFPGNFWDIQKRDAMLGTYDAITALSKSDELYYRNQNVNAVYIPNPVRQTGQLNRAERPDNIAVIGRLDDKVKGASQSLEILREIVQQRPWFAGVEQKPWIKMIFIGSFSSKEAENSFLAQARNLGVQNNIQITGWCEDIRPYLKDCAIMLSTSWMEGFSMAMGEAQAAGLPIVMWDIPFAACEDNPAIIRIPHGDIRGAATAILQLLDDEERWNELSRIAIAKMRQFSPDKYIARIISLLGNFQKSMPVSYYTAEDYNVVMRTLGFYAGNLPPWHKK